MRRAGRLAPARLKTRVNALVPDRCMPRINRQRRRSSADVAKWALTRPAPNSFISKHQLSGTAANLKHVELRSVAAQREKRDRNKNRDRIHATHAHKHGSVITDIRFQKSEQGPRHVRNARDWLVTNFFSKELSRSSKQAHYNKRNSHTACIDHMRISNSRTLPDDM